MARTILSILLLLTLGAVVLSLTWPFFWIVTAILAWLLVVALRDSLQNRHTLLRNYPLVARARWWAEELRPKVQQYFIEKDIGGTPIDREHRSIVYARAKGELDSQPFGSEADFHRIGYEWMEHSLNAQHPEKIHPKMRIKVRAGSLSFTCNLVGTSSYKSPPATLASATKTAILNPISLLKKPGTTTSR